MSGVPKRSLLERLRLALELLREYELEERREAAYHANGGARGALASLSALAASLPKERTEGAAQLWREAVERHAAQLQPKRNPPSDLGAG